MKRKHILTMMMIVVIDQITKLLITFNMDLYDSIDVIKNFFAITYVQNTGGAWSMLEGGNMLFFYLITLVALVLMMMFYKSEESNSLSEWSIALMMGGTLGNFIDRVRLQYVVDFFSFNLFGYPFPIFNVADIFLCLGVGVLILSYVIEGVKKHEA